jgi:hypothetical protein
MRIEYVILCSKYCELQIYIKLQNHFIIPYATHLSTARSPGPILYSYGVPCAGVGDGERTKEMGQIAALAS